MSVCKKLRVFGFSEQQKQALSDLTTQYRNDIAQCAFKLDPAMQHPF